MAGAPPICTAVAALGNFVEMDWVMDGRCYAIRFFPDQTVSFFNGHGEWTDKHGRCEANKFTGLISMWFHYLGKGERMAAVSTDMCDRTQFEGYDYRQRPIVMRPRYAMFNSREHINHQDIIDMTLNGCALRMEVILDEGMIFSR